MKPLDAQTAALTPGSYHDFSGLAALKGKAKEAGQGEAALRAAAQQFEAMFVQEIMRNMRQASMKSDLLDSSAMETFEGMFDKEVSVQLAKRGSFGMADMLVQQMKRHVAAPAPEPAAADVLRSRAEGGLPLQRPATAHPLKPEGPSENKPAGFILPQPQGYPLRGRGGSQGDTGPKAD